MKELDPTKKVCMGYKIKIGENSFEDIYFSTDTRLILDLEYGNLDNRLSAIVDSIEDTRVILESI